MPSTDCWRTSVVRVSEFSLTIPPMLSRSTVDRADEIRDDPARMRGGWPGALVLVIDGRGRYPVADNGLRWIPAGDIGIEPPEEAVFLGIRDGADLWALRGDHVEAPASDPRRGAHLLDGDDAGLLATATAMLNWHDSAHFSPVDGKPTRPARGGWVRRNIDSGIDEFPRTDAAIITVVHDGADRILLSRQAVWPDSWNPGSRWSRPSPARCTKRWDSMSTTSGIWVVSPGRSRAR